MEQFYITKIHIDKVRHLENIDIPLSDHGEMKHLILTGKNGSGKTSLLEALREYLNSLSTSNEPYYELEKHLKSDKEVLSSQEENHYSAPEIAETKKRIEYWEDKIKNSTYGLNLTFNVDSRNIREAFEEGEFILAYFDAHRTFKATRPESIEKVEVKKSYSINETPRNQFLKYMLDLKMTQALAASNGKKEKAEELQEWFDKIQQILRDIYEDQTLTLEFDEETYRFTIHTKNREPFDFNNASDGFSAILDIIVSLIMRMQEQDRRTVEFTKPGIVLIDEIEDHLHLELQRKVLNYLTGLFPNIQFIVSTHSPFIVISLKNAVIYDLENKTLASDGLNDVSYSGAVEGYFKTNELSEDLQKDFDEYKSLIRQNVFSPESAARIVALQNELDEMPDYLMPETAAEYRKLKLEFENREGIAQ